MKKLTTNKRVRVNELDVHGKTIKQVVLKNKTEVQGIEEIGNKLHCYIGDNYYMIPSEFIVTKTTTSQKKTKEE